MPDVPGSGALNAGYAVTYGNEGDMQRMQMVNLMQQQVQARQDKLAQEAQQQQAHIAAMKKRYGAMFDPKNYDTLTDVNIPINEEAESLKKGLSELLNSNAPQQDVDNFAIDGASRLQKMYQIGTAIKRNIDSNIAPYKNSKNINWGSVGTQAYLDTLYKKDPATGKMVMKNVSELAQIPSDFNPVAEILKNNPDKATSSSIDVDSAVKNMATQSVQGNGAFYGSDGFKHKSGWKANYNPLIQDLIYDKDGTARVVTINHPVPLTDIEGNPIIDPKTGKPSMINQISDEAYNHFVDTPEKKIITDAATIRYLRKDNPDMEIATDTPAFYQASKEMLYNAVKGYGGKAISKTQDVTAPAFVIKNMMGLPTGSGGGSGAKTPKQQMADITASFNDITGVRFIGNNGAEGKIENGKLVGFKGGIGSLFNGGVVEGKVPIEQLPLSLMRAVSAYAPNTSITGKKYKEQEDNPNAGMVDVKVKNGRVVGVRTDNGPYFSVDDKVQSEINTKNKLLSIKNKILPKKNDNSYYNDPDNVSNNSGGKITYKDGTVWQVSGGKLKKIK